MAETTLTDEAAARAELDPWAAGELDLDAYLARIGVARRGPSVAALVELHEAHVSTIPFENVDVLLGRHPGVALSAVQDKLVARRRGGYCFEQATLMAAALSRLGYDVERHLGRVGDPARSGRTHFVVLVTIDGRRHLADPGFGFGIRRPVLLEDGVEDDQGGWRFGVRRVGSRVPTWELRFWRGERGWELLHTVDELPVVPADVEIAHHFTSTFPRSAFRTEFVLTRHGEGRHTTVSSRGVTVRVPGEPTTRRPLDLDELPELLDELGAGVTPGEAADLARVLRGLRAARTSG